MRRKLASAIFPFQTDNKALQQNMTFLILTSQVGSGTFQLACEGSKNQSEHEYGVSMKAPTEGSAFCFFNLDMTIRYAPFHHVLCISWTLPPVVIKYCAFMCFVGVALKESLKFFTDEYFQNLTYTHWFLQSPALPLELNWLNLLLLNNIQNKQNSIDIYNDQPYIQKSQADVKKKML